MLYAGVGTVAEVLYLKNGVLPRVNVCAGEVVGAKDSCGAETAEEEEEEEVVKAYVVELFFFGKVVGAKVSVCKTDLVLFR